jgi:hypothetical protein
MTLPINATSEQGYFRVVQPDGSSKFIPNGLSVSWVESYDPEVRAQALAQLPPLPANLNPGIRKLVHFLRASGFQTTDSGDGETHDFECDPDHAYVAIGSCPATLIRDCQVVQALLEGLGVVFEGDPEGPSLEASYSPIDGFAFVLIFNVKDRDLSFPGDSPPTV